MCRLTGQGRIRETVMDVKMKRGQRLRTGPCDKPHKRICLAGQLKYSLPCSIVKTFSLMPYAVLRQEAVMPNYYVNKNSQSNRDHEVHTTGCSWLPDPENRIYLGNHVSCHSAVTAARKYYAQVNGCYYCSNACHTS